MFKDELDGKVMTKNTNARAKTYAYVYDNGKGKYNEKKKAKGAKKCVIKIILNLKILKEQYLIIKQQYVQN